MSAPVYAAVSTSAGCTLGEQYSAKIPAPPMITFAAPPTDCDGDGRGYEIGPVRADAGATFLTPGQRIQIEGLKLGAWKYPHRREAQSILPYLYLGPASYAREIDFLQSRAITMLVIIAPSKHSLFVTAAAQRSAQQLNIPCHLITADAEEDMSKLYKSAIPEINTHLTQQYLRHSADPVSTPQRGTVFLASDSGNHSSAALAAAYLMHTFHDVDHTKAMSCVTSRRMSCDFTSTIRQSLYTWHLWLEAQRSVGEAARSPSLFPNAGDVRLVKHKRSFVQENNDDDDSMDVDDADDAERFRGRRMTPFMEQPG